MNALVAESAQAREDRKKRVRCLIALSFTDHITHLTLAVGCILLPTEGAKKIGENPSGRRNIVRLPACLCHIAYVCTSHRSVRRIRVHAYCGIVSKTWSNTILSWHTAAGTCTASKKRQSSARVRPWTACGCKGPHTRPEHSDIDDNDATPRTALRGELDIDGSFRNKAWEETRARGRSVGCGHCLGEREYSLSWCAEVAYGEWKCESRSGRRAAKTYEEAPDGEYPGRLWPLRIYLRCLLPVVVQDSNGHGTMGLPVMAREVPQQQPTPQGV